MIRVVAAVIVRDGKVLICQRHHTDSFPLKWEFPGGKIEPGEDDRQALVREIREELGVEADIVRELERVDHRYRGRRNAFAIAFFLAHIGAQEPQNLAFEKFQWEGIFELPSFDFLEANGALVRKIATGAIKLD